MAEPLLGSCAKTFSARASVILADRLAASEFPSSFSSRQTAVSTAVHRRAQKHFGHGDKCPRLGIIRIDFDRALAQADNSFISPAIAFEPGGVTLTRQQIQIVGVDVLGAMPL